MTADIIPFDPLRYRGNDPGLRAQSRLPKDAGLASRVRTMAAAGSSASAIDDYVNGWAYDFETGSEIKRYKALVLADYVGDDPALSAFYRPAVRFADRILALIFSGARDDTVDFVIAAWTTPPKPVQQDRDAHIVEAG